MMREQINILKVNRNTQWMSWMKWEVDGNKVKNSGNDANDESSNGVNADINQSDVWGRGAAKIKLSFSITYTLRFKKSIFCMPWKYYFMK